MGGNVMSVIVKLDEAIRQITYSVRDFDSPFFFIVGAGISSGSIPTASEIINICKQRLGNQGEHSDSSPMLNEADEYSHWLQMAYPQPILRQRLFKSLIDGAKITSANFKLAHLLSNGSIAKLVVTPNFDNLLQRALVFFNKIPIICDHPGTSFKIDPELKEIQIVHVHGTHLSYDCCNLTVEIDERNNTSTETTATMASLVDRILSSRSPIVIGYSGWERDVIMTSLKKRLKSPMPFYTYWFCYSEKAYHNLPEWLKENSNVIFVLPETGLKEEAKIDDKGTEVDDNVIDELDKVNRNVLDANYILDKLIASMDLPAPKVAEEPLDFLIDMIKGVSESGQDGFFLSHVIDKIEKLKEHQNSQELSHDYDLFNAVRSLVRRSKYDKVTSILSELNYKNLDEKTLRELIEVLLPTISWLLKENEKDFNVCQALLIDIINHLGVQSFENKEIMHICQNIMSFTLDEEIEELNSDILPLLDFIINNFEKNSDKKLKKYIAGFYLKRGLILKSCGKSDLAIKDFEVILSKYNKENGFTPFDLLAALELISLIRNNEPEKLILILSNIISLYEDDNNYQNVNLAKVYYNLGLTLYRSNKNLEALVIFDKLINKFRGKDNKSIFTIALQSILIKGFIYKENKDLDNALEIIIPILDNELYKEHHSIKNIMGKALVLKSEILAAKEDYDEAISTLNQILTDTEYKNHKRFKPTYTRAQYLIGDLYEKLKDYEKMIEAFEKNIRLYMNQKDKDELPEAALDYIAASSLNLGYHYYNKERNIETALNCFTIGFQLQAYTAGINLFYMYRKGEISLEQLPATPNKLIEESLNKKDPYALVNMALYLVDNGYSNSNEKWIEADKLIKEIRNNDPNINDVVGWWWNLRSTGDIEGDLVLYWLKFHNKSTILNHFNNDVVLKQLLSSALNIPDFLR
jgi:tetratricopeptide (TPR) repeat protein